MIDFKATYLWNEWSLYLPCCTKSFAPPPLCNYSKNSPGIVVAEHCHHCMHHHRSSGTPSSLYTPSQRQRTFWAASRPPFQINVQAYGTCTFPRLPSTQPLSQEILGLVAFPMGDSDVNRPKVVGLLQCSKSAFHSEEIQLHSSTCR